MNRRVSKQPFAASDRRGKSFAIHMLLVIIIMEGMYIAWVLS